MGGAAAPIGVIAALSLPPRVPGASSCSGRAANAKCASAGATASYCEQCGSNAHNIMCQLCEGPSVLCSQHRACARDGTCVEFLSPLSGPAPPTLREPSSFKLVRVGCRVGCRPSPRLAAEMGLFASLPLGQPQKG
eukprot:scaffold4840_cov115-Isochrysis_galbana.AAC.17